MLKALHSDEENKQQHPSLNHWIDGFVSDFRNRFANLLGSVFHQLPTSLCLSLITANQRTATTTSSESFSEDLVDPVDGSSSNSGSLPEINYKNVSAEMGNEEQAT